MDDINAWIKEENEKRMAEAEALRARYEKPLSKLINKTEQAFSPIGITNLCNQWVMTHELVGGYQIVHHSSL